MTRRIHLIRHGQTAWNAEKRWQGFESVPLNETGIAQARALAAYWPGPLNAIYSSDLDRAWRTAVILGEATGVAPTPEPRLREFHVGIFQGLTSEEMRTRHPADFEALSADYMGYVLPRGESRYQLQARAYAAWSEIVASDPEPEIALVTHGGTLQVLLFKLFGETPELHALHIRNTSITTLVNRGGKWEIERLAETPHLERLSAERDER